jgi:hypothetical protein
MRFRALLPVIGRMTRRIISIDTGGTTVHFERIRGARMQYILVGKGGETETPADAPPPPPRLLLGPATADPDADANVRRHARTPARELLLRLRVGAESIVAKVEDLSVGGVFARSRTPVPVGAYVEMWLLQPGRKELPLSGVVVDDIDKRAGLAVRFENLEDAALRELRRVVLDQQIEHAGNDPDAGLAPALPMGPSGSSRSPRDKELDELRRRVGTLQRENEHLQREAQAAEDAQRLVGRLRLEIERLKARVDGAHLLDTELLTDIRRDAEVAWAAVARLSDNVEKLK